MADLGDAIDRYGQLCRWVGELRPRLAPEELHEIAYEDFVSRPGPALSGLCSFLGVGAPDPYLADCASVVWPQTRQTRHGVEWSDDDRRAVDTLVGAHPFLAGYSWDS